MTAVLKDGEAEIVKKLITSNHGSLDEPQRSWSAAAVASVAAGQVVEAIREALGMDPPSAVQLEGLGASPDLMAADVAPLLLIFEAMRHESVLRVGIQPGLAHPAVLLCMAPLAACLCRCVLHTWLGFDLSFCLRSELRPRSWFGCLV